MDVVTLFNSNSTKYMLESYFYQNKTLGKIGDVHDGVILL